MIKRVHLTAGVVLAAVIAMSGCGATKPGNAKSSPQSASTAAAGAPGADSGSPTGEDGDTQRSRPTERSTPTPSLSVAATRPLKDGTAVLTHCADADDPYTTVVVRNPNEREGTFGVKINYKDTHGFTMSETYEQVLVAAKGKARVRAAVASAGPLDEIERCEVNPRATAVH
ncbi:hypothetical protein OG788_02175 [Streptomyces sp. NBC_00647]|uniref:hypothetical protein n=1 Tax=Streptomyces sp. NBC_00647 TaxID=2975796 RepID=UPI00324AD861